MTDAKTVSLKINNELYLHNVLYNKLAYSEENITINANSSTTITVTNFFYPTTLNPHLESGELTIIAISAYTGLGKIIKYPYALSRSGTTRTGVLGTAFGTTSLSSTGSDLSATKSSDNLNITFSTVLPIIDGRVYVYKTSYLDNVDLSGIKKISNLYAADPVVLGNKNCVVRGKDNINVNSGVVAVGVNDTLLLIPDFFDHNGFTIGEGTVSTVLTSVRGIKSCKYTYINYGSSKSVSSIYSYVAVESGGSPGGGNIFEISTLTNSTALRIIGDTTSNQTLTQNFTLITTKINYFEDKFSVAEYPPLPMYNWNSLFANARYGNGNYIASASNFVTITTGIESGVYFAFDKRTIDEFYYHSGNGLYTGATGQYAGTVSTTTTNGTSYSGEWVQLQLPLSIILTSYNICPRRDAFASRTPRTFAILGSNNGKSWVLIDQQTDIIDWDANLKRFEVSTIPTTAYSYYRLVTQRVGVLDNDGTAQQLAFNLADWQLFDNTNTNSTINSYPPLALTANTTNLTTAAYSNGSYTASASTSAESPFKAFDKSSATYWATTDQYNSTTGEYTGAQTTTISSVSYSGEWIQIQLPQLLKLTSFTISPRTDSSLGTKRSPRSFVLGGSNNGSTWTLLEEETNINDWDSTNSKSFSISANAASYLYYRLVVRRVGNFNSDSNQGSCNISEIILSGYRILLETEATSETQLPNSILLDATTYISGSSWVDSNGLSNATLYNTSNVLGSYLGFNGTTSYATIPNTTSLTDYTLNDSYSISFIIYIDSNNSGTVSLLEKYNGTGNSPYSFRYISSTGKIEFSLIVQGEGSTVLSFTNPLLDQWIHIVGTYSASTKTAKLYYNGQLKQSSSVTLTGSISNSEVVHLMRNSSGSVYCTGRLGSVQILPILLSDMGVAEIYNSKINRYGTIGYVSLDSTKHVSNSQNTWGEYAKIFNSPTFFDNYFTFNGSTQYAEISSIQSVTDFDISDNFSISVWVYVNSTTSVGSCIVEKYSASTPNRFPYVLRYTAASTIGYYAFNGTTTSGVEATILTDRWINVVATYRASDKQMAIYVDGDLKNTTTSSITDSFSNSDVVSLMRRGDNTNYATGRLGIVQIYPKTLTSTATQSLFDQYYNTFPTSVLLDSSTYTSGSFTYPPIAMFATTTTLIDPTGKTTTNGLYVASASSVNSSFPIFRAFDKITTTYYQSAASRYNANTGVYVGSNSVTATNSTTYSGEHLQLLLPRAVVLSSYAIRPRTDNATDAGRRSPRDFVLLGSNDGSTWTLVNQQTGINNWTTSEKSFTVTHLYPYTYYRIVVSRVGNLDSGSSVQDVLQIGEMTFTGVLTTVLHDTNNLGHAILYNSPTSTQNYLTFNGSTQYGELNHASGITNFDINDSYTINIWIFIDNSNNSLVDSYAIVEKWVSANSFPYAIRFLNGSVLFLVYNSSISATPYSISTAVNKNEWVNITATYRGSDKLMSLYINGTLQTTGTSNITTSFSNTDAVNIMRRGTSGGTAYCAGRLGIVQIHPRCLNSTSVLAQYNSNYGKFF